MQVLAFIFFISFFLYLSYYSLSIKKVVLKEKNRLLLEMEIPYMNLLMFSSILIFFFTFLPNGMSGGNIDSILEGWWLYAVNVPLFVFPIFLKFIVSHIQLRKNKELTKANAKVFLTVLFYSLFLSVSYVTSYFDL